MRLLDTDVQALAWEHIERVLEIQLPESTVLDYKETLPDLKVPEERRKLLKDVAAMANAAGGIILFGISEKRDTANDKTNLPDEVVLIREVNCAEQEQRLGQLLRSGLEPPLSGFRMNWLGSPRADGFVLALGIPASFARPHAVTVMAMPFYHRVGADNHPHSVDELRRGFLGQGQWMREIEQYHRARLEALRVEVPSRLIPGGTPLALKASMLLHILPFGRLEQWHSLVEQSDDLCRVYFANMAQSRWTFDGLLRYVETGDPIARYVLWLRCGGAELFGSFHMPQPTQGTSNAGALDADWMAVCLIEWTLLGLDACTKIVGVPPPFAVCFSLSNLLGFRIHRRLGGNFSFISDLNGYPIPRPDIVVPPVYFQDARLDVQSVALALQPILDAVWQSAGLARCPLYGEDGQWKGRALRGWKEST